MPVANLMSPQNISDTSEFPGGQWGIRTIRLGELRNRKSLFCLIKGLAKVLVFFFFFFQGDYNAKYWRNKKLLDSLLPYHLGKLWGAWHQHLSTEFFRFFQAKPHFWGTAELLWLFPLRRISKLLPLVVNTNVFCMWLNTYFCGLMHGQHGWGIDKWVRL